MAYFKYLRYLLRHKWFVFLEACKLGIPFLGIIHDISKFTWQEFVPYAKFFYGKNASTIRDKTGYYKPFDTGSKAFEMSCFYHGKHNKHHWQWWARIGDGGAFVTAMEMPIRYRKEMLADWRGAGRAQHTLGTIEWYTKHRNDIVLGEETRKWIEKEIGFSS